MTDSITVTRTYVCPLESSNRKSKRVKQVIDEWQSIAAHIADLMPGIPEWRWGDVNQNWLVYIAQNEHPTDDINLRSHDRDQAYKKVSEAFGSWVSNGKEGRNPKGEFGDASYARFCHCGITITENDRGYGLKVGLEPYDPEWFHINAGPFQYDVLERVVDENDDEDTGSAELHLDDNGNVSAHLTVTWNVEVPEPTETTTTVGVDVGERAIYAATCMDDTGTVVDVDYQSGKEFRHHRERLTQRVYDLMEKDDLRGVKDCRGQRERYTEHVVHNASRSVVDMAVEHDATIAMENLTGYRESAKDPIHDWPFAMFQEQVAYKATGEGVPVVTVDAAGTSNTCRKCGHSDPLSRQGAEFECVECGYKVNADVNAAMNIAQRGQ